MSTKIRFILHLFIILSLTQCSHAKRRAELIIPNKLESKVVIPDIRVALVLGGGGSRGISHIGVIKVLEENNIPIDLIVGTSAGSAVGALYSDNKDAQKTKDILFSAKKSELLDFSFLDSLIMFNNLSTPIRGQAYENFIFDNLEAKNFSELKIPLVIVTVDVERGEKFIIKDGPIAPAVRASSAVPPIIAPVLLYDRTLIDGGVIEPVPVATAKLYKPKLIIAIDINNLPSKTMPSNVLDLAYRSLWLSYYQLSREQAKHADFDIHPNLLGHGTFEDDRKEELYELGRSAALEVLPMIKKKLKQLKIKKS